MSPADSKNITIDSSRRKFMAFTAAASAVAAGSLAVAAVPPTALPPNSLEDTVLLKMKEEIFALHDKAHEHDDELHRLQAIWMKEWKRLREEQEAGRLDLTPDEIWTRITRLPEGEEHTRLTRLTEPFHEEIGDLTEQMMAITAKTSAGRAAKVLVLVATVMGPDWTYEDADTDWHIRQARGLLIELVGGEPAKQLRNQFA